MKVTRIVTIIAGLALIVGVVIGISLYNEHEADRQAAHKAQQAQQEAQQAAARCKAQGDEPQSNGTCTQSIAHRDCTERGGAFTPTPEAFSAGTCNTSQAPQRQPQQAPRDQVQPVQPDQARRSFDKCVRDHGGNGGLDARAAAEDWCNAHGAGD